MIHKPLALDQFPEQLRRNVDPSSPAPLRMMAARGMLPAAPRETVMVLYQLSRDSDAAVAEAARRSAKELPRDLMIAAAGTRLDPRVLDFLARSHREDDGVLEAVLTNQDTDDETYVDIAERCSERITEVIAVNEVRLLRTPKIIERLYMNEHARMSTVDRLIDLAKRHKVKFELHALQSMLDDPGYNTSAAAAESQARAAQEKADAEFKQLLEQARTGEEDVELSEEEEERLLDESSSDDGEEKEDDRPSSNIATRLLSMTISEKMRMAMLGSAAEREFLIKDSNRLVHMAAVTSPKVRLKDVQSWAGNRMAPDGVLSYIAGHRRYRRVYQIITNLVNNPKTPVKDSLRLLTTLAPKDLKTIQKNRNVSHQVRRQAKVIMESREKKRK
jgi:hypothetical protein